MKKILSAVFVVALLCTCLFAISAYAEAAPIQVIANESWTNATYDPETGYLTNVVIDNTDPDNPVDRSYMFKWTVGSSTLQPAYATNTDFPATATEVVFPSQIVYNGETYNITTLDNKLLGQNMNAKVNTIKRMVFSEGITAIPAQFDSKNGNLNTVKIYGNTITSIGDNAFNSCSGIREFDFPESLTTIAMSAFNSGHAPSNIVLHWKTTNIGSQAFGGKSGINTIRFKASGVNIGSSAFKGSWGQGPQQMYFEGAKAPTLETTLLHDYFRNNLTVHYPANRASYATFENDFNVASGIYAVTDGVADTSTKTGNNTGNISYAKIQESSSVINDVTYDAELNEYKVFYNVIIGESDWATYNSTASACVALYDANGLMQVKTISLTDDNSSVTFSGLTKAPTEAKLFVWADRSSTIKPILSAAEKTIR